MTNSTDLAFVYTLIYNNTTLNQRIKPKLELYFFIRVVG